MLGIRQGFLGDVDAGWEVAYTPAETPPTHTHTLAGKRMLHRSQPYTLNLIGRSG